MRDTKKRKIKSEEDQSRSPKRAKLTKSGRLSVPSTKYKEEDYELTSLAPKSRGYFNLAFLYDKKGQVYVEPIDGKDDFDLVDLLVDRFDDVLSPSDVTSKFSVNGTPIKETQTPRKRQFKHLLKVTVRVDQSTSVLAFYQVANSKDKLERHPPVYHDPSTINPVTPPQRDRKKVSGRVSLQSMKRNRRERKKPSTFYRGTSANDVIKMSFDSNERNAHSHLVAVHQVGEFGREGTVAATEGQNITQMAFEDAIDKALEKLKGSIDVLYADAEATLQRDNAGRLTHVGETQTLSYATSPGKHSAVEAEFNSQDPNRATRLLAKSLGALVHSAFSGCLFSSEQSSRSNSYPETGENAIELEEGDSVTQRLDFSSLFSKLPSYGQFGESSDSETSKDSMALEGSREGSPTA